MKLFVLLPSYNEEKALPYLLESMQKVFGSGRYDYEIVVINDGSADETANTAIKWRNSLNITLLNHEKNMGLGEAVNTGFLYFCRCCDDGDIAIVMDADNTHRPSLIPVMANRITSGSDVVIASRYESGGNEIGLSLLRRLCSAGANIFLKTIFRIPGVNDYTCGYRAYSGRIIKKAYSIYGKNFVEEKGFTCMAEILIKLFYAGCEISEVPLILRYDLKRGRSKMKVINTIIRYFLLVHNIRRYRSCSAAKPA